MHILVTNDDGPPSLQASPYILSFVNALESQGHTVSIIIPDIQRSWIGKAHIVGQDIVTAPYWPPSATPPEHNPNSSAANDTRYPWILVNSTPATCVQIGISHFFNDRGPIDLVISGPNYGRNTTAVFALSSGTLGAALEASVCGYRAIALSFAFFNRDNEPDIVAECCEQAVRISSYLAENGKWGMARLYSINVPVLKDVSQKKVIWTKCLQNQWKKGACFQEVPDANHVDDSNTEEAKVRKQQEDKSSALPSSSNGVNGERHFKWAPRFTDVFDSVEKSGPGSDGWTVKSGETSVTALFANFQHQEGCEGEIDLSSSAGERQQMSNI